MTGKIIAKKLNVIESAILGVKNNTEIQNMLSAFGYTPERLNDGLLLLEKAIAMMSSQVDQYATQYEAHGEYDSLLNDTYAAYMVTLKVIRVAFTGKPDILSRFCATGQRSKSLSGWLRESRIMYTNLLNSPDALKVIAEYGYTEERLNGELQQVNKVEELHSKHLENKGGAQQKTLERDKAIDDICNWFSSFRAIARIALYEKPQLIEALGIVRK